jgi:hypothetical protein
LRALPQLPKNPALTAIEKTPTLAAVELDAAQSSKHD